MAVCGTVASKDTTLPNALPRRNKYPGRSAHFRQPATAALKLFADPRSARHTITAYGADHVAVNGRILRRSLLLTPDRLDVDWGPDDFPALAAAHFAPLVTLACDVILLGTGNRQRFPAPALLRPLIEAGRPVEVMDTPAACRTYNILMAEGRAVAAALIVECGRP
jgi:uncharacterized protein